MDREPRLSHNAALKFGLREMLFRSRASPAWVFSPDATAVLLELWADVAKWVDEPDRQTPEGLEASTIREIEGHLVRVISFPEARWIAENHFAAIAFRPERRSLLFWKKAPASLRYLALEYGMNIADGTVYTVLGEWTVAGHLNYGKGPVPNVENFLEAVRPILARPPAALMAPQRR